MCNHRASLVALVLPALLALAACSTNGVSNSDAGPDAGDAGSPDAGDAGSADGGDAGSCSPPTTYGGGEQSVPGGSVTAAIVDETGAPIAAGQPLYICGLDICSAPATTTSSGTASISTSLQMKRPAFKYGDTIDYAGFAIPLNGAATDFTATGSGKLATAKLSGKPGATLTPGGDAISGDVTVSLTADSVVGIDTLVYSTADQQKFRAVSIPLTNMGPVLADAPANVGLLFGMAPSETLVCPPAKVTVALPAGLGWAAGAAVEFWVMTTDTAQTYAPYAGWAWISDGVVSADGLRATTTQGFNFLENFVVRLK